MSQEAGRSRAETADLLTGEAIDLLTAGPDLGLPFDEMRAQGLLWAINRTLVHPRGFSLAFVYDAGGELTGWTIQGDGTEPWHFPPEDEDEKFRGFETLLATMAGVNGRKR